MNDQASNPEQPSPERSDPPAPPPLPSPQGSRKKRSSPRFGFCFALCGIILPILALGTELIAHWCYESGLPDPIPNYVNVLLILSVPAFNFLAFLTATRRKEIPLKLLGFLGGIALITSIYHSILFALFTHWVLVGMVFTIWYFGAGLLGFLPLAPLLSFIATLNTIIELKKRPHVGPLSKFVPGLLAGVLLLFLAALPRQLTLIGLRMASSPSAQSEVRGIRLLRKLGNTTQLNRACYPSALWLTDPFTWITTGGDEVSPTRAQDLYYRVTGEAFHSRPSPTIGLRNRVNPGDEFDWDPEQGGDVVAGRLKGLSLAESRMDGSIDADAATAYMEWVLVFENEHWDQREARAQIALPPGAVVSRLTLWIDGEEREAAFGGRSQVKEAYRKVVRRRRDPVLVTTSGPDRVLMQCFPVPSGGEMKVRIGITSPLQLREEDQRLLKLPYFLERNFRIQEQTRHAMWMGDHLRGDLSDLELREAVVRTRSTTLLSYTRNEQGVVEQQIRKEPKPALPRGRLNLVIDSSVGMKSQGPTIAAALSALPEHTELKVFVADDELREITPDQIGQLRAAGGKNNAPALRAAMMDPSSDRVLWIHGPQNWELGSGSSVLQVLERRPELQVYAYQIGHGPQRLLEHLGPISTLHIVPAIDNPESDLRKLLNELAGTETWALKRRQLAAPSSPHSHLSNDHLERLYIFDLIQEDLSDGDADVSQALDLALSYALVTPVSGAVVLETQQQYDEAGLTPLSGLDVPTIPEPSSLALVLMALLILYYRNQILGLLEDLSRRHLFAGR